METSTSASAAAARPSSSTVEAPASTAKAVSRRLAGTIADQALIVVERQRDPSPLAPDRPVLGDGPAGQRRERHEHRGGRQRGGDGERGRGRLAPEEG